MRRFLLPLALLALVAWFPACASRGKQSSRACPLAGATGDTIVNIYADEVTVHKADPARVKPLPSPCPGGKCDVPDAFGLFAQGDEERALTPSAPAAWYGNESAEFSTVAFIQPDRWRVARADPPGASAAPRPTPTAAVTGGPPRWAVIFGWLVVAGWSVLALALLAGIVRSRRARGITAAVAVAMGTVALLAGCQFRPAIMEDVDEVRSAVDDLREDIAKATVEQQQAFKDHMLANPGDFEGAVAKAFGANVDAQLREKTKRAQEEEDRRRRESGGDFPVVPVTGGGLGILGLAYLLIRRAIAAYDAQPLIASDGRPVPEAKVADAGLKT